MNNNSGYVYVTQLRAAALWISRNQATRLHTQSVFSDFVHSTDHGVHLLRIQIQYCKSCHVSLLRQLAFRRKCRAPLPSRQAWRLRWL